MVDDLFYCGAAFNLASGGDFSNPMLARFFPNEHFFFAYPPVHSYALAGWLKLFGLSALSATAFQGLMYCIISLAVMVVLHRNQAAPFLAWIVPLITIHPFFGNGLRTEPLAVALTWTGFAIIECGARRWHSIFLAVLLMCLAGATAPRNAVFDTSLIVLVVLRLWRDSKNSPGERKIWLASGIAAAGVSFLIFLCMIHFQIGRFLAEFRMHSGTVKRNFGEHYGALQLALMAVAGIFGLFALRFRADRLIQICIALGAAFGVAMFTRTLGYGPSGFHALLMILFLCAALLKRLPVVPSIALQTAVALLMLGIALPELLPVYGELTGRISKDRGAQCVEARAMLSSPEHQLFVDPWVARYCFDYKIPAGSIDFLFSNEFPTVGPVMIELMQPDKHQPRDTYILGPRYREYVQNSTYAPPRPAPKWVCLRHSYYLQPCNVAIILAEQCKALKSASAMP